MATPGAVVKCVAHLFGASVGALTEIDRALADEGGREKGGRGRSALHLRPNEVANLLITAAASPLWAPKILRARDTFLTYSTLRVRDFKCINVGLTTFQELPPEHTFADAVEALMIDALSGELQVALNAHTEDKKTRSVARIFVRMSAPIPSAQIYVHLRGKTLHLDYNRRSKPNVYNDRKAYPPEPVGDLSQTREFSHWTLLVVAELLAQQRLAEPRLAAS